MCADVNIMPASVYKLVYRDSNLEKLALNKMQIGTFTNDTVKIVGTCKLYLVHPDTDRLIETTFYVATNDGCMLRSCSSTLDLDLIQPRSRLDYLPPQASLITSTQDHPRKMRQDPPQVNRSQQLATQSKPQAEMHPNKQQYKSKLITNQDHIMAQYPYVFEGIGNFPGPPYTIHLNPVLHQNKHLANQCQFT